MSAKYKIALIGYFAPDIIAEITKRVPPGFEFEARRGKPFGNFRCFLKSGQRKVRFATINGIIK